MNTPLGEWRGEEPLEGFGSVKSGTVMRCRWREKPFLDGVWDFSRWMGSQSRRCCEISFPPGWRVLRQGWSADNVVLKGDGGEDSMEEEFAKVPSK